MWVRMHAKFGGSYEEKKELVTDKVGGTIEEVTTHAYPRACLKAAGGIKFCSRDREKSSAGDHPADM